RPDDPMVKLPWRSPLHRARYISGGGLAMLCRGARPGRPKAEPEHPLRADIAKSGQLAMIGHHKSSPREILAWPRRAARRRRNEAPARAGTTASRAWPGRARSML